jgi:hypothetical protein
MTPHRRWFGFLLLILLAHCEAVPETYCKLTVIAQKPLQLQDRLLVSPAGINGKWVHLVVDTGPERTTISSTTDDRLGLPHDARFKVRSVGIAGAYDLATAGPLDQNHRHPSAYRHPSA